jgi:hypothetical protein
MARRYKKTGMRKAASKKSKAGGTKFQRKIEAGRIRSKAARQLKKNRAALRPTYSAIRHLKANQYAGNSSLTGETPKETAIEILTACGIDTTLMSLDQGYKSKFFTLVDSQTDKQVLTNINDDRYAHMFNELKQLDVKKISLSDAIRELDARRDDPQKIRLDAIKGRALPNFIHLANRLAKINSRSDTQSLKYFKIQSSDSQIRISKLSFQDKIIDLKPDRRFGEQ